MPDLSPLLFGGMPGVSGFLPSVWVGYGLWLKKVVPTWHLGRWKQRLKPA